MRKIAAFGLLMAMAAFGAGVLLVPKADTAEPLVGGSFLHARPAPDFHLTDQFGHSISLAQLRDHPILLTFLWTHGKQVDPVVAETLRRTAAELGPAGRQIAILAVSTDPEGDTRQAVWRFSRRHGMLDRWQYLTGTRQRLARIWRAYYVFAPPRSAPQILQEQRTPATYLIDARGRERVLFSSDLNSPALVRDLRILAGLPLSGQDAAPAPEVGHIAPAFVLPSVRGADVALRSFRGKVVLVNFWATWCTACRREMPELMRWYRKLKGRGFVVLGVDKQESPHDVAIFLRRLHVTYPVVLDESGNVSTQYGVMGLPTSFLVDRNGVVRSVKVGIVDPAYLTQHIKPLLSIAQ